MRVTLKSALSDSNIDANQSSSQRQLMLSIAATSEQIDTNLPINLCLVLDHSGSMQGKPLETVKKAALSLIESLGVNDRLSVIAFDHRAKVILPSQSRQDDLTLIRSKIQQLRAGGGTAIDEGIKLGIQESSGSKGYVSHIFLLTDGENEHGDNERCLKLAAVAAEYGITLNTFGFGDHWNQDILEKIADIAGGSLSYIERPEQALIEFTRLFNRLQSVRLTNAFLQLELDARTHLADLKPIAQVAPETIEMSLQKERNFYITRLGDLMIDEEKILLLNLYIDQIPPGTHTIAKVKIRYDDPASGQKGLETATFSLDITSQALYQSQLDEQVQKSILTLAKYRQTQIAEEKLKQGDRAAAATMLQTAAKTALQLGEKNAATVLQTNATRLQVGEELSEGDLKKTRIVAKTRLQTDGETGK
ncbi:MAG: VWA domain-containing protein [Microcystis aeruginosa W13-11]|nr:VWA domain-containing protein [Microcystis aeruginosa W13-11]